MKSRVYTRDFIHTTYVYHTYYVRSSYIVCMISRVYMRNFMHIYAGFHAYLCANPCVINRPQTPCEVHGITSEPAILHYHNESFVKKEETKRNKSNYSRYICNKKRNLTSNK